MSNSTITSATQSSTSSQVSLTQSSGAEESISSSIASSVSSEILSQTSSAAQSTVIVTNTASSVPPTTEIFTSIVTQSPTNGGSTAPPVTVVVTSISTPLTTAAPSASSPTRTSAPSSTSSSPASLANNGSNSASGGSGGLSTAGKTAIAVVVPVVVVALLVLAALLLWRKRKQKKAAEEQRRKEVEDYGFNPNNDPTLPAVATESPEMTEDQSSGYRGWGAAAASRKASTTLSGGHTHGQLSDAGSNPYGPSSPEGGNSDDRSDDPLVNRRQTMNSDELGALGAAPVAGAAAGAGAVRRGPSNASSRYSNGARSEGSDEPVPQLPPLGQSYEYNQGAFQGYSQAGPYGDGSYGGGQQENGMPIVRDVSARRNTRIQQGGTYQQGNSGIAQNF